MLHSKLPGILVVLFFALVVIILGWWAIRQNQTPAAVSSPAPNIADKSVTSDETSVNSILQVSAAKVAEVEKTSGTTTKAGDETSAPLAPGEVSEAEIIAEGLTPGLLDAELNSDGDALYHNRIEYSIAPAGIQGPPGDPNRP